ncbi:hypothetical protein MC7420_7635 [Coleofasciculus chthonoplastes PCC 7420]|uniref:Uncharacterized protein n=1 Tax=Coleofasciculus chthonoplastes PCC 7420 TaxID=118168 RepID=B4VJ53_9CYAN|nr:hypothetical protein MC7420_7635 [Coleofasciculus chthonoplastes PCC 7420]
MERQSAIAKQDLKLTKIWVVDQHPTHTNSMGITELSVCS